jgi:hypothetical protein
MWWLQLLIVIGRTEEITSAAQFLVTQADGLDLCLLNCTDPLSAYASIEAIRALSLPAPPSQTVSLSKGASDEG